jgi:hypothetical protein
MANRFPLIVDTDDGNKIKELPTGDNLDLSSAGISNLTTLSVSGALSSNTLSVAANATITGEISAATANISATATVGTLAATSITLGGADVGVPVQSNWTETDNTSLAFIRNKPDLSGLTIDELDDIGDVFVSGAVLGDVLKYDGFSWQAQAEAGGVTLADFSVVTNPTPAGNGSLVYNNSSGVFTFTQPAIPTLVSQLTNDAGYTTLTAVQSQNYLQVGDIIASGRITYSATTDQVTLGFDDTGLLTSVQTSGNISGNGLGSDPIVLNDTITLGVVNATDTGTASVFRGFEADDIVVNTTLTSTNGNLTFTNGAITATNGNITATNGFMIAPEVQTATVSNTGNVTLNASGKVAIQNTGFTMGFNNTLPTSGVAVGDIWHLGNGVATYVSDVDGVGTPGWIVLGGTISLPRGMQVPVVLTQPSSPRVGEMIWNDGPATPVLQVYDGSGWVTIGP